MSIESIPDKTEIKIYHCNICKTGKIRVESNHYTKKGLSEMSIGKCDNCNYQHDLETIFDCEKQQS